MKLNLCTLWRKRSSSRSPDVPQMMYDGRIREFKYKELQKATKNFSEELGSGCFGSVHRGMLPDSTLVAVKKLVKSGYEFRAGGIRTELLDSVHHINLLPLIGICHESDERILVFDYMPRRSLDLHLFYSQVVLDWNRRYQIALGIARGLAYLHSWSLGRYFQRPGLGLRHGNIKPQNIVLDSDFCPKLTDYFVWLFWEFSDCHSMLTSTSATRSYTAPELLSQETALGNLSSDVYSYGMLLFEIVSGIRNSENGETPRSFPTMVASVIREGGHILSVLDSRLGGTNGDEEEVLRVCKVACWCIHHDPLLRPSMEKVIQVLEGVIDHKHCRIAFN